ncbi:MAG: DnaJ domain-containing protein [Candidatus Nealsonbacteria bacterium]|nr:DnaJ domain-containing protein [Candidatus Nealsonbacteria bacterium]
MSTSLDCYGILEISPRASPEIIKAAFRTLAQKYHPDVYKGKDSIFKKINEAFQVLSDPLKKAAYDEEQRNITGKVIGNRYRILERIAKGGHGYTYKGEHIISKQLVCIKHCCQISPQDEEILINETNAVWDLRHTGLPAMRDLFRLDDGNVALVMSFIPGKTWAKIIEEEGRQNPETVCWITERILNILMYMHYHGVVHGDLKPLNIIVQETHEVALVDFGLSMVKPGENSQSIGFTPIFASPEEEEGQPIVPESDFYSLGMTMIFALSGGDEHATARKMVPNTVPEPLVEFIKRLIVRDVLSRPRWETINLFEEIRNVRLKCFGRMHSGVKK